MLERPLISVIIPVYKTPEKYLRSCIESVLNQSIYNIEVVIVDDGSPDKCGEICDEYEAKDSRVKVIHKANGGVSSARNKGIEEVSGKYLTFIDSDDILDARAWEIGIARLNDFNADCVVFGWNDFLDEQTKEEHWVTRNAYNISSEEAIIKISSDNFLCGGGYPWNKIWNADRIKQVHGTIPKFSEDIYTYEDKLWIIETLKGLGNVVQIPDVLYEYRYVSESLTQSEEAWKKRQFNAYKAYDLILEQVKKNKEAYSKAVTFYFLFCYKDLKNMYPYRKCDKKRFKKTKHCLAHVARKIRPGDLPKLKYNVAWLFFLFLGWI